MLICRLHKDSLFRESFISVDQKSRLQLSGKFQSLKVNLYVRFVLWSVEARIAAHPCLSESWIQMRPTPNDSYRHRWSSSYQYQYTTIPRSTCNHHPNSYIFRTTENRVLHDILRANNNVLSRKIQLHKCSILFNRFKHLFSVLDLNMILSSFRS